MSREIKDQVNEERIRGRLFKTLWQAGKPRTKVLLFMILGGMSWPVIETCYPLYIRYVVDNIIIPGNMDRVIPTFAIMFLFPVCMALSTYAFIYYTGILETELAFNIRSAMMKHLHRLDIAYFDRVSPGYILARVISDVGILTETLCWGLIEVFHTVTYIVLCVIVVYTLGLKWGLIITASSLLVGCFSFYIRRRVLPLQRDTRKLNSEITSSFSETVHGAMSLKTLNRGELNRREFSVLAEKMQKKILASEWLTTLIMPVGVCMGYLVSCFVLYEAGKLPDSFTELGTIYAVFLYANNLSWPLGYLSEMTRSLQIIHTNSERIVDLLTEPVLIKDEPEVLERYGVKDGEGKEPWPPMRGAVSFQDVDFSYVKGEQILSSFNLDVPEGSTIAIVGETGAGKSTLVNLICRFYQPQQGKITIDGHDIRELPLNWLYSHLSYVLQNPFLFAGTVADNIRYAKPEATLEEVIEAAKSVFAHDFISRLENGYDTLVGEGGNRLSTGEKQLVSFARALLADPSILILDEATSSVDTETEKQIQRAIDRILQGRTSFVIAHRLSTIESADRILVIDDGTIIESGTHEELLQKRGAYYDLYQNQFVKMEQ